jgi:hypothetical protein
MMTPLAMAPARLLDMGAAYIAGAGKYGIG